MTAAQHSEVRQTHTQTHTQALSDSAIKHAKASLLMRCVAAPVGGGLALSLFTIITAALQSEERVTVIYRSHVQESNKRQKKMGGEI